MLAGACMQKRETAASFGFHATYVDMYLCGIMLGAGGGGGGL